MLLGLFLTCMFGSLLYLSFKQNSNNIITYIVGMITIIILLIFVKIMPKRNFYGNKILGKIRGFKKFLEVAEKQQLEDLVNKDPQYFYNILPYTYALDVSSEWASKFETIAIQPPDWYTNYSTYNFIEFNNFMYRNMIVTESSTSSYQSNNTNNKVK